MNSIETGKNKSDETMRRLDFQIFDDQPIRAQLGESPCWDPSTNVVWWVDIIGKTLLKTDLKTHTSKKWDLPEQPGFVVLTGPDCPALGMQTGIFSLDQQTGNLTKIIHFGELNCRFNDATIDQNGNLWASTMDIDAKLNCAKIFQITTNLELNEVVRGLSIPNGLAVDLSNSRIYFSDSHPDIQKIWTIQYNTQTKQTGQTTLFANTTTQNGRPDGAALDQDGNYWIAGVDGHEIYVFDLKGFIKEILPTPFSKPTKISFSGNNNRTIHVTSKESGTFGGYLAQAELPDEFTAGVAQPYWKIGSY